MSATAPNLNQKRGEITGGLVTEEFLASSDTVLKRDRMGGTVGAQQFYTPSEAAKLVASVIGRDVAVFDPTAGDGSLVQHFDPHQCFGVEIDPDQVENAQGRYKAIQGDFQHVYTILRPIAEFQAIVANPPFGLEWSEPTLFEGKEKSSTLLTLAMVNRLLAPEGQFAFVAGKDRFDRECLTSPESNGIYAVVDVPDLFPGTVMPCVVAFGVNQALRSSQYVEFKTGFERRECPLSMLDLLSSWVLEHRERAIGRRYFYNDRDAHLTLGRHWPAVQAEYRRRTDARLKDTMDRQYDVELYGGNHLQVAPSPYAKLILAKHDKAHLIQRLNNTSVNYFIQNERDWLALTNLERDGLLTIDPRAHEAVGAALEDIRRVLCPLYPVQPAQRLGFLSDVDTLLCVKDDPERGFTTGTRYELETSTFTEQQQETRTEQIKSGKRAGEWEDRYYTVTKKVMKVRVGHWTFTDSEQDTDKIVYLLEHFELPDPGDVGTRFPEETEANRALLHRLEDEIIYPNSLRYCEEIDPSKKPVRLREFQREDLARLLVKGDGMLSWEQGLGKTLGGFAFALARIHHHLEHLRCKEQVLIITPKDLIPQWCAEAKRFIGRDLVVLGNPDVGGTADGARSLLAQAHKLAHELKLGKSEWVITYPEALATIGTTLSVPAEEVVVYEKTISKIAEGTGRYGYYLMDENGVQVPITYPEYESRREENAEDIEAGLEPRHNLGHGYINERIEHSVKQITSRECCPQCRSDKRSGWNGLSCEATDREGNVCGYVHTSVRVKPAGHYLSVAFRNGVIINDEATMVQGDYSKRSLVIRGLRARAKLGMTGTPIKNYVPQAFWPLWWCLGNNSPRFGYGYKDKEKFEENFAVHEHYRVKGDNAKKGAKALPEVTNLSRFWRMIASSIIRRRKEDTGEPLVPRYFIQVDAPLGKEQLRQTNKWLKSFPTWFAETYPDSKVVQAGMHVAMAPMLGLQTKLERAEVLPLSDKDWDWSPPIEGENADVLTEWQGVEVSNFTPAVFKTLELAMALAKKGEKVLIGSPLVDTSAFLAEKLAEKGVNALHILDSSGQTQAPGKRAKTVSAFRENDVQVLCTGIQAIRYGHNLDTASTVILLGLPWDFETFDQFIARVHRLTSRRAVSVYVVVPGEGTVSAKKWELLGLKSGAASLALDGRIVKKQEFEFDRNEFLSDLMTKGIQASGDEVDEDDVERAWNAVPTLDEFEPAADLLRTPELGPRCPWPTVMFDRPIGPWQEMDDPQITETPRIIAPWLLNDEQAAELLDELAVLDDDEPTEPPAVAVTEMTACAALDVFFERATEEPRAVAAVFGWLLSHDDNDDDDATEEADDLMGQLSLFDTLEVAA